MSEAPKELKHLRFVQQGTQFAYLEGEWLYTALRSFAPEFLLPSLELVEGTVYAKAYPLVVRASELLALADDKVDEMLGTTKVGTRSLAENSAHMKSVESYLAYMTSAADYVVEKLNLQGMQESAMKAIEDAREKLKAAVKKAGECTDPDVAVQTAWEAWSSFAEIPAVAKVIAAAEPATKMGFETFYKMHDSLVANPYYKTAVANAGAISAAVTSSSVYKMGAENIYPYVAPVADPAIAKVANSETYSKTMEYWKPADAPIASA